VDLDSLTETSYHTQRTSVTDGGPAAHSRGDGEDGEQDLTGFEGSHGDLTGLAAAVSPGTGVGQAAAGSRNIQSNGGRSPLSVESRHHHHQQQPFTAGDGWGTAAGAAKSLCKTSFMSGDDAAQPAAAAGGTGSPRIAAAGGAGRQHPKLPGKIPEVRVRVYMTREIPSNSHPARPPRY